MILLSVLDQSPIRDGQAPAEALGESVALAQACERWGYHRYWVAEHHSSAGLAGTAPEVLIARLASVTATMRVGSGGIMLSHYSPLKVAESFRVLEALFPGRIDLGIGRAPGSDQRTARALAHGPGALDIEQFPNQIADLLLYLRDRLPQSHPFLGVHAQPVGPGWPEPWLLGSSDASAQLAAYFGCAFSYAHFISDQGGKEIMAHYHRHLRQSPFRSTPQASIGVFVICAETEAAAQRLALSRDLWRVRLDQGIHWPFPSVEEAEAHVYTPEEQQRIAFNRRRQIVGDPAQVKAQLLALGADYGVDEFVIVSICYDFAARLRSYELLAREFGLAPRAAAPAAAMAQ